MIIYSKVHFKERKIKELKHLQEESNKRREDGYNADITIFDNNHLKMRKEFLDNQINMRNARHQQHAVELQILEDSPKPKGYMSRMLRLSRANY